MLPLSKRWTVQKCSVTYVEKKCWNWDYNLILNIQRLVGSSCLYPSPFKIWSKIEWFVSIFLNLSESLRTSLCISLKSSFYCVWCVFGEFLLLFVVDLSLRLAGVVTHASTSSSSCFPACLIFAFAWMKPDWFISYFSQTPAPTLSSSPSPVRLLQFPCLSYVQRSPGQISIFFNFALLRMNYWCVCVWSFKCFVQVSCRWSSCSLKALCLCPWPLLENFVKVFNKLLLYRCLDASQSFMNKLWVLGSNSPSAVSAMLSFLWYDFSSWIIGQASVLVLWLSLFFIFSCIPACPICAFALLRTDSSFCACRHLHQLLVKLYRRSDHCIFFAFILCAMFMKFLFLSHAFWRIHAHVCDP